MRLGVGVDRERVEVLGRPGLVQGAHVGALGDGALQAALRKAGRDDLSRRVHGLDPRAHGPGHREVLLRVRLVPPVHAEGGLVLLHGRGVDETDLFPLLDENDFS